MITNFMSNFFSNQRGVPSRTMSHFFRFSLLAICQCLMNIPMQAQDLAAGANAIEEAATSIEQYFDPISNVVFAIATIIAILGAVRVYTKWSMGDPDVMSSAAGWFGSAIFLIAAVAIVKGFFGIG